MFLVQLLPKIFMNFSPHLLIDACILSAALTITLVLRSKGNALRKEKENRWHTSYMLIVENSYSHSLLLTFRAIFFM